MNVFSSTGARGPGGLLAASGTLSPRVPATVPVAVPAQAGVPAQVPEVR